MDPILFKKLVKFDRKCNVIFASILNFVFEPKIKFGNPDHTLSTVFAINRKYCYFCGVLCFILEKIDDRHCEKAYKTDYKRIKKLK